MARLEQHRHHDSADIAQMPSDQHAHDYFSFDRLWQPAASAVLSPPSGSRLARRLRRPAEPPGHAALLDHVLQHLLVLQGVHRAPEALMLEGKQLIGLDQPPEGRLDQLLALLQIVEDLGAEDEEAAIDPEVGILRWRLCD